MELIEFGNSDRTGKKLKAIFIIDGKKKTYHFGSDVSKTYSEGADETKKENYIKRHKVNEIWDEINPASLSRLVLWGKYQNINKNLKLFLKRFKVKDMRDK